MEERTTNRLAAVFVIALVVVFFAFMLNTGWMTEWDVLMFAASAAPFLLVVLYDARKRAKSFEDPASDM